MSISIFNIIALKDIFDPSTLRQVTITKPEVLACGKKWRIKTKEQLPLWGDDANDLRELKVAINAMPTDEEPLSQLEVIALSGLLYRYIVLWPEFAGDITKSSGIPFERGVYWLKQWAFAEVPVVMPDPAGRFLKRLFNELTVDPLLSQMCSRCSFGDFNKQWSDIFQFNIAMRDMHIDFMRTHANVIECHVLYGVSLKSEVPAGWNDDATRKFLHIAKKNVY